jgi:type IV secretory pathway component VirB8
VLRDSGKGIGMATPDASYLQALKNNHLLVRVVLGLSVVVVALVIAVISLFPLKTKEFVLYEFVNGSNNMVRVIRANQEIKSKPLLIGYFLRHYVQTREPINQVDERNRYAKVRAMSADSVFNVFRNTYGSKESPLFRNGFQRSVEITRDAAIEDGIHQVEFRTRDKIEGQQGETVMEWVANIAYEFSDRDASYDERYFNPLGMVITKYALASRSTTK